MMTTVYIARTILSETTTTVETATADRYVKSADVDVVTVQAKRQQRRPIYDEKNDDNMQKR